MRLIDADVLHSALNKMQKWVVIKDNYHNEGYSYDQVHFAIDNAPTVDAERHGHWIGIDDEPCETYECDKCGYITEEIGCNNGIPNNFKYCPNCGAKMDEVEE